MSPSDKPSRISAWPAAIRPTRTRRDSIRPSRTTCTTGPPEPYSTADSGTAVPQRWATSIRARPKAPARSRASLPMNTRTWPSWVAWLIVVEISRTRPGNEPTPTISTAAAWLGARPGKRATGRFGQQLHLALRGDAEQRLPRPEAIAPTTAADDTTVPAAGARTGMPGPVPCPSGGASRARIWPATTVSPGSTCTCEICSPSRSGRTSTSVRGPSTPVTCRVSEKQTLRVRATVTARSGARSASRLAGAASSELRQDEAERDRGGRDRQLRNG